MKLISAVSVFLITFHSEFYIPVGVIECIAVELDSYFVPFVRS